MTKRAIIIGAGPAGLTAAWELLTRTDIIPIILEKSGDIGGISKTVNYKGNRMDIGGHRFFSKSDRVMKWWLNILPLVESADQSFTIQYQHKSHVVNNHNGTIADPDKVMLVRKRLSRIYFLRQFFTYPISLSIDTLRKLGIGRTAAILASYLNAQAFPRKPEKNLEDFMVNRFGKTLYELFFRDYTEKVWGVPCNEIPAEWGAQRIKGVSIRKAIEHAIKEVSKSRSSDLAQKDVETSLIEQFLYPKLGPGQLWEEVARQVQAMGGIIHMNYDVQKIHISSDKVEEIYAVNNVSGDGMSIEGDYFFSTMPVKELIASMIGHVPPNVLEVASGLQYRDFITVGILLSQMSSPDEKVLDLKDNWIYIQDNNVKVGRLQIFNNWSPYMVADPKNVWVGMEFFCNTTDAFWKLPDNDISALAVRELERIGLANSADVLDSMVLRVEKTYPAYFGAYERFGEVRTFTDQLENLFLVGRNGMHKYNNADHSMLTAMVAVDNIAAAITTKDNIWEINTEQKYHEEKSDQPKAMQTT
jgi:protoporphyrinogen oxidase